MASTATKSSKPTKAKPARPNRFPDKNESRRLARNFIKERIDSLQKDVMHCLQPPYAPFPAILYCVATIDLLGALCYGIKGSTSSHMQGFVKYTFFDLLLESIILS